MRINISPYLSSYVISIGTGERESHFETFFIYKTRQITFKTRILELKASLCVYLHDDRRSLTILPLRIIDLDVLNPRLLHTWCNCHSYLIANSRESERRRRKGVGRMSKGAAVGIVPWEQTPSRYNETQFPAVGAGTESVVSFVLAKSFTPHACCVKQSYLRSIR